MDEDRLTKISAGIEAQSLLNNEIFDCAVREVRGDLLETFAASRFEQSEERDEIWRKLQAIDAIVGTLHGYVTNAHIARERLAEEQRHLEEMNQ